MTGTANRRRGGDWERAVAAWFTAHGWTAERAGGGHRQSYGDIIGIPGWHLECKNTKSYDIAGWCDTADMNPVTQLWAVIVKRRQKHIGQAYVVINLHNFTQLLKEAGYL